MKQVKIIGMGLSPDDLTAAHLKHIREADILIGGKRHLAHFKDIPAVKREINKGIGELADYIKAEMQTKAIVVLASGDPLFFGIGAVLVEKLGAENVSVYPNITTIAAAFARIKTSWHDVKAVSLHGRSHKHELLEAITTHEKIAVFTDPVKNPSWLEDFLVQSSISDDNIEMGVFEALGSDSEQISWHTLTHAREMTFAEPNLVVLKRLSDPTEKGGKLYLGMPEESYVHQKGMITKAEVRAVSISKLRLCSSEHILWDLGAGSGSVAIEAGWLIKKGKFFALEQNSERIEQIEKNRKRFAVNNMEIVHAVLPGGLANLPRPDRIFIGGGGKSLGKIIETACEYLLPGGVIVINTVLLASVEITMRQLGELNFHPEIIQIQINRGRKMPWGERLEAQNPVWIISGEKPGSQI